MNYDKEKARQEFFKTHPYKPSKTEIKLENAEFRRLSKKFESEKRMLKMIALREIHKKTLREIAKEFGLTHQRIQQILSKFDES